MMAVNRPQSAHCFRESRGPTRASHTATQMAENQTPDLWGQRLDELGLRLEGSPVQPLIERLYQELDTLQALRREARRELILGMPEACRGPAAAHHSLRRHRR